MFIGRRADGSIYGCWTCPQPKDADHPNIEEVPDNHPDLTAFLNRPQAAVDAPVTQSQLAAALTAAGIAPAQVNAAVAAVKPGA